MNRTLKVILVVGVAAALTVTSFAQGAGPVGGGVTPGGRGQGQGRGGPGGMKRMQEMQEKILAQLNLTSDQKSKIKSLNKTTGDSFKKLMDSNKGVKPQQWSQADKDSMKAIRNGHRDGLMKILTKDQQTKYKDLMKAQMDKMRAERGGGSGAPPQKP